MSEFALQARNLTVKNNRFTLGPLNLDIPKGAITCIVGRNGAGKTTLLKTLLGKTDVVDGGLSFGGFNYLENENEVRKLVASVLEEIKASNTVNLTLLRKSIEKIDSRFQGNTFNHYLNQFGINLDSTIPNLSLGQRKKLSLAIALSLKPEILFLDELTSNFDVVSVKEILEILQDYMNDSKNTIIMATNSIHDVETISDYVLFLKEGRIEDFDNIESLKSKHKTQSLKDIFLIKLGDQR